MRVPDRTEPSLMCRWTNVVTACAAGRRAAGKAGAHPMLWYPIHAVHSVLFISYDDIVQVSSTRGRCKHVSAACSAQLSLWLESSVVLLL